MITDTKGAFNLWQLLLVLARRRKFIVGFVLLATVTGVVVALVLPKWYRAKTSILPAQYDQPLGISGSFAQYTLSTSGFQLPIMATPSDVYATMLKSETVARGVITDNDLLNYLHLKSPQECERYLLGKTSVKITGEGVVELYFMDRDPAMAATVANSYIVHLDRLNREVKAAKARSDKAFIHGRLQATKTLLDSARAGLLAFQTTYKAIDLPRQKEVALQAATELKSRLVMTQVTLDVKRNAYSPNHPDIRQLEYEIAQLRYQLAIIEDGSGVTQSYFDLGLSTMPELAVRYAELQGNVTIQEKVYELLTNLFEEARIKEQKDTPTIAVLETAYPPELKYRPQRSIIVMAAFAGSLVLALFLALFADYLQHLRRSSPSDFDLIMQARNEFTGKTGYPDS